jgi:hypothetical protein
MMLVAKNQIIMNLAHTGKDNIQLYNMKGVLIFLKVSENDLISVC